MLAYVIEQDDVYADVITHTLEREGHSVLRADTARGAVRTAELGR